jgi:hypothetical protein
VPLRGLRRRVPPAICPTARGPAGRRVKPAELSGCVAVVGLVFIGSMVLTFVGLLGFVEGWWP